MPTDAQLLAEYVDRQSEAAFAQLVERHIALVHSAALRQVGDAQLAGEITQAVFIIFARKAGGLGANTVLPGWLCRTAHFAARDALKTERRRQQREQEAYMQSQLDQPTDSSRPGETTADAWLQIAPLLDAAVAQLREADRNAIVLRIYEQRPLDEVGAALGIGADAAQKRVTRALDKLRAKLVKQGVTLTATVIAGAVAANSVQAAPVTLVQTISAIAVTKGAATTASTLTLVKGALKLMAWKNLKLPVIFGVSALLIIGGSILQINSSQHQQQFEVSGTIRLTSYFGTNIFIVETNAFSMGVKGNRWALKAVTLDLKMNGIASKKFDYILAGCDGQNTFTLHSMETSAKQETKPSNVATADICDETIPSHADDFIRNLWLAYASADYFSSVSNQWIYPLFLEKKGARSINGEFAVKGNWQCLPGKPALLASVIYTFDFEGNLNPTNHFPATYNFSENSTNAVFKVLAYTNYGETVLPTHFTVKHYLPNGKLVQEVEVFSQLASKTILDVFSKPHFPGLTYISDFRLAGTGDPITYIATNWFSLDKVKQLQRDQSFMP